MLVRLKPLQLVELGGSMSLPAYRIIQDDLMALITSGALQPGDRIPSENELAAKYRASRLTVQRALREIVSHGFVTRTRGSGTYVSTMPWQFSLLEVRDPEEEIRSRGGDPARVLLVQEQTTASAELATVFEVGEPE